MGKLEGKFALITGTGAALQADNVPPPRSNAGTFSLSEPTANA